MLFLRDLAMIDHPLPPATAPAATRHPLRDVVLSVFSCLDGLGRPWLVPHGYKGLPDRTGSDLDIIIDRGVPLAAVAQALRAAGASTGARVVREAGGFITLRYAGDGGLPAFLNLDVMHDYRFGAFRLRRGEAMLAGRRASGQFYVPHPGEALACQVMRTVLKDSLGRDAEILAQLFQANPFEAASALAADWPEPDAQAIVRAATSGDWRPVIAARARMARALRLRLVMQQPGDTLSAFAAAQAARAGRLFRPQGLHVVLLGPDGAGKSSTIAALETALAPLFATTEVLGFAPTLKDFIKRKPKSTATPHALKARSPAVSLLRAGWWTAWGVFSHLSLRWSKARSRLILNDRHFVDILVDPVRYRYGGPRPLLKLVWAIMPRPDVVILLDGPAEVLQARKRELTVEETARQSKDYLALVRPMKTGHVVDATQSFAGVVNTAADIVLAAMAPRP
jgi:thymidylate kinase